MSRSMRCRQPYGPIRPVAPFYAEHSAILCAPAVLDAKPRLPRGLLREEVDKATQVAYRRSSSATVARVVEDWRALAQTHLVIELSGPLHETPAGVLSTIVTVSSVTRRSPTMRRRSSDGAAGRPSKGHDEVEGRRRGGERSGGSAVITSIRRCCA
jgi:hypothetical protein